MQYQINAHTRAIHLRRPTLKLSVLAAVLPALLVACGGGGSNGDYTPPTISPPVLEPFPQADYSAVDAAFQTFIDDSDIFDGISYVLVDEDGVAHQKVFGDHTTDLITMLASTSKVPVVMAIMALDEDPDVDFSIAEPVSTYLPFDGVYADRTVEQMVSNTSGIPGLRLLNNGYGSPVGPTLADFGVSGVLADPSLSLISGSDTLATNSQWLPADGTTFAEVGGFPLGSGSNDAAIVVSLGAGSYTTPVETSGNDAGVTLLEVYDGAVANESLKVVNTSTRAFVGTGDDRLVPGFVVQGSGVARLLIRAVGPGLSDFGVNGVLADPKMTLYRDGITIATNDNWSAEPSTEDAATASGAFALTTNSLDSAMLVSLEEGLYTVAVEGANGETGTALFELYLAPSP